MKVSNVSPYFEFFFFPRTDDFGPKLDNFMKISEFCIWKVCVMHLVLFLGNDLIWCSTVCNRIHPFAQRVIFISKVSLIINNANW